MAKNEAHPQPANAAEPETTDPPEVGKPKKRSAPRSYTIKAGETLAHAAAALGTSEEHLIKTNALRHDLVYAGQRLHL